MGIIGYPQKKKSKYQILTKENMIFEKFIFDINDQPSKDELFELSKKYLKEYEFSEELDVIFINSIEDQSHFTPPLMQLINWEKMNILFCGR